jgi:ABC-type transporter Mla subunit MlaD
MILKRVVGIVILLIALSGVALCVLGLIYGPDLVDNLAVGLESQLDLAADTLDMLSDTLVLAKDTTSRLDGGLQTLNSSIDHASQALAEVRPLLTEVSQIVSEDVPEGLEAVEAAVPGLAQTAGIAEDLLITLSNLELEQKILGYPIRFDLGLDYSPDTTMAESITALGESLEGMGPKLRGLEVYVDIADGSLETIGEDLVTITGDLVTLNETLVTLDPLLDEYLEVVSNAQGAVAQTSQGISQYVDQIKLALKLALVWLALTQIAPIYVGWSLVAARRRPE